MVDTAVSCSVFVKKPAINTLNGRREDSNEQGGVNVGCGSMTCISGRDEIPQERDALPRCHSFQEVAGDALGASIRTARRGVNRRADVSGRFGEAVAPPAARSVENE